MKMYCSLASIICILLGLYGLAPAMADSSIFDLESGGGQGKRIKKVIKTDIFYSCKKSFEDLRNFSIRVFF